MGDMEIPDELIDQLLGEYRGPEQLTGPDGLINQLRKRLIERAAGVELEQHLGYRTGADAPDGQPNRRNGMTTREIQRHLRELYGVDVSDGLISEVTASIQDDVRAWQSRPLEELYVAV